MSLFESGHSKGQVSLAALLNGQDCRGQATELSVPDLMERVEIGGWSGLVGVGEQEARAWLRDYLQHLREVDVPAMGSHRTSGTLHNYLNALDRLVLTETSETWRPHMRSRTRLRSAPQPPAADVAAVSLLKFTSRADTARHGEPAALGVTTSTGCVGRHLALSRNP